MRSPESIADHPETLLARYRTVRATSEAICAPLATDDYQLQSITETSPPKWHLAHVSWFFETFLLKPFDPDYRPFHPRFDYLFNSYYETVGSFHPRAQRGLLSRPTVEEIYRYRAHVDAAMQRLVLECSEGDWPALAFRLVLGLNHEEQHQELLYMDVKHNFAVNPLRPAYFDRAETVVSAQARRQGWVDRPGGIHPIGASDNGFAFDNELPRHEVLLREHRLADRLVTNGEYLEFIEDEGYGRADLWLADGWFSLRQRGWHVPLYWEQLDGVWYEMTLSGLRPLSLAEPVCHVSYYEADAYARWAGARLPGEAELELMLADQPLRGNFVDAGLFHPRVAMAGDGQWFGDLWEWTSTPYGAYPGFQPLEGSMGEYNGKFMCNQMVLRGGCCVTPQHHVRASYSNFFYPHDRWAFTGIRLARNE